jgi:hypothetical protein
MAFDALVPAIINCSARLPVSLVCWTSITNCALSHLELLSSLRGSQPHEVLTAKQVRAVKMGKKKVYKPFGSTLGSTATGTMDIMSSTNNSTQAATASSTGGAAGQPKIPDAKSVQQTSSTKGEDKAKNDESTETRPLFVQRDVQMFQMETKMRREAQRRAQSAATAKQPTAATRKSGFGEGWFKPTTAKSDQDMEVVGKDGPSNSCKILERRRRLAGLFGDNNTALHTKPVEEKSNPYGSLVSGSSNPGKVSSVEEHLKWRLVNILLQAVNNLLDPSKKGEDNFKGFTETAVAFQRRLNDPVWMSRILAVKSSAELLLGDVHLPIEHGTLASSRFTSAMSLIKGCEPVGFKAPSVEWQKTARAAAQSYLTKFSKLFDTKTKYWSPKIKDENFEVLYMEVTEALAHWVNIAQLPNVISTREAPEAAEALVNLLRKLPMDISELRKKPVQITTIAIDRSEIICQECLHEDVLKDELLTVEKELNDQIEEYKEGLLSLVRSFKGLYMECSRLPDKDGRIKDPINVLDIWGSIHEDFVELICGTQVRVDHAEWLPLSKDDVGAGGGLLRRRVPI